MLQDIIMIEFNVGVNSLQRGATKCQDSSEENLNRSNMKSHNTSF